MKLIICGAGGRMGQAILGQARQDKNIEVTGLIEAAGHPLVGQSLNGIPITADLAKSVAQGDVVIDFTAPESTIANASVLAKAKKGLVVGTTGLLGELREKFLAAAKGIPVVFSPNMSVGANLLFELSETVAKMLPDFDVEITEIHHNLKKDSPSGTAERLAEGVVRGHGGGDETVYGRHGMVGARKKGEVGVHALRGGDVVGDHTVYFIGRGERVELIHRATTRDAFASGAVRAAKWLVGKKPGVYTMRDVLKK